jgi:transcriptional regulator with XRE-family HTH domain
VQRDGRKSGLPLGERIKSRRKGLGLTLQQLANMSGLSAPFISQAERDLTTPSLVSLLALAKALDVEIDHFMLIPDNGDIVHRADDRKIIAVDSPVTYYDLSSRLENRQMDVIMMRIPPGHAFPVDQRNGEDMLYLISGELRASAGQTETVLQAGDSMHFDSRLPHSARNDSDEDAVLLYVGTPSAFRQKK